MITMDEFNELRDNNDLRLVVLSSKVLKKKGIVLVDANGLDIGRDRSWYERLRLPEMAVSKFHAQIYLHNGSFHMSDTGSQNGTFVNGERLSESRMSSVPWRLNHLDKLEIGSSLFQVHYHRDGRPCADCQTNSTNVIDTQSKKKNKVEEPPEEMAWSGDLEQSRREQLQKLKKAFLPHARPVRADYVDRASLRRQRDEASRTKTPYRSALHGEFIEKEKEEEEEKVVHATLQTRVEGVGNRMLRQMGWREGTGLGRTEHGALEPIAPSTQVKRAGLGWPINEFHEQRESKRAWEAQVMEERYKEQRQS